jgi:hypothetical protein
MSESNQASNRAPDWMDQVQSELSKAEAARAAGNEGMARVCARRAAGIAAGEYLQRLKLPGASPSAFDKLRHLGTLAGISSQVKEVTGHFLMRITTDHRLPIEVDLIAEARWLVNELFDQKDLEKS